MVFTALLFLTLISTSQTQTASIVMKAAVGETITVGCPQAERYKRNYVIWWCKATSGTRCDHISSIGQKVRNDYRGTSIADTNGRISVTIRHLEEKDTGTYWCGALDNGVIHTLDVILLKVFTGTWEPIVSEISGVVGNVATVPCLYTEEEKSYQKFLCKVTSRNKCTIIASSNGAVTNLQNGSVSITINNSHNFTVTLGNINKADEGEYWCGAETVKNINIVQVKNLTTAEASQTQTASIVVRAAVGETITVGCPQAERYKRNNVIWWCKATWGSGCDQISSIDGQKVRNDYRRTSITDTNGKISVTIQKLEEKDTGTYWCGLEDKQTFSVSDVILLKVFTGTWEPIVSEISGVVGNVATVPCLYTEEENYYKKFLCKVTSINKCTIIASSDGAVNNLQNGSVSITINNSQNFTVTLGNINKADEGEYWCGAVRITNIKIVQVKNLTTAEASQTQTASIVLRAAVGETITVGCPQAERYKRNYVIWWCRAISGTRFNHISSIYGQTVRNDYRGTSIADTNGKISITIQHLEEKDTGTYWCGPGDKHTFSVSDVILLKVFTGTWEPIVSEISGVVGNVATVPCMYTEEEKYYQKFLCKVTSINKCTIIASSNGAVTNLQNGSVSITINNFHNFTVTLGNINKADEGEYWCGATRITNIKIVQVKNLTTAEEPGSPLSTNDPQSHTALYIIIAVVLGLLILPLLVLFILRTKKLKAAHDQGENENVKLESPATITKFDREAEDTITYSTVEIQTAAQREGHSATYANLKNLNTQSSSIATNSESVEYSTLVFKP
ncbi:polymeric immunoglobulin receptor-like [Scyliorhinus canicula]|uniref:polymeric immunoglobulin receptor-like n=1 Tax=Scyliorhinus canicula TaxID=7830 RepID=UPI0018F344FD|nr:polymeric immunoglobulin receptor-like [Scyliorhinus canicula]